MRKIQVSKPCRASQVARMLHVSLQPQIGSAEENQSEDQAEIIARNERVAQIPEGDHEDAGCHHQGSMKKHLRERVGLMNDGRADDDYEHGKQTQCDALQKGNSQSREEPASPADRKTEAEQNYSVAPLANQ